MKYFPKVIKCIADLELGNKFLHLQTGTLHHIMLDWPLRKRKKMGERAGVGWGRASDWHRLDSKHVKTPRTLEEFETGM